MLILYATCMHTGTHVLGGAAFPEFEVVGAWEYDYAGGKIARLHHFVRAYEETIRGTFSKAEKVFTTLRHPARVLESFKRRQRGGYEDFLSQWDMMTDLLREYDTTFIHVDREDLRDREINEARESLGLGKISIDWTPRIELGCYCGTHDLQLTDELVAEVPDWMVDFYNKTIEVGDDDIR